MEHDSRKDLPPKNDAANLTRRGLFELAGLAVATAVLKPELAMATRSETPKADAPGISAVMEKLSSYMSEAATRPLPDEVVEKAKQHVLDTLAAMISGSELTPGCLAGLNPSQMRFLLDSAAQHTSGIGAWSRDAEHMEKAFLFGGKPAAAAVTAAMLIRSGWTGVDHIFSGPDNFFEALAPREGGVLKADPAILVDKLGERYEITRTNIKKWTVGSPIQAPLDALARFFQQRSFTADEVTKVVVRIASDEAN